MPFSDDGSWRPSLRQERFLAIPDSIREAGYLGGAGSGKSELLLMYPIVRGFHHISGFKQVFMRRTFPELRNEIVPRSRRIYPKFGATFNKTDMIWTFPSGAMILLGHCENESDVSMYDSMEINLFTPDEITSFTEYIYLYISFTRVRSSDKNLPAIIRSAGMPGGIGHTWVKKRFIDPHPAGSKILVGKGGNKRIFIFATLADNPYIDPEYNRALDALPEAERQAKKYGNWDAFEGSVFDEFRDRNYPGEPENAVHVIPPFEIPSWWPRIVAIDWGYNAMCSIGWGAISPSRKVYVYRHQMFFKRKIEEWAPEVHYWVDKDKPVDIIICHSANQHRGDPHTILEQVNDALGQEVRLGEKDRIGGKLLVHEYLRWKPKPHIPKDELGTFSSERAAWILRNKGLEDYNIYTHSFTDIPKIEDLPRLLFFDLPDVKVICDAIKSCVYEKSNKDGKNKEDVAEFNGDDPYDQLRMLLTAADQFFSLASNESEKLEKTAKIIEQLEAGNDMTAFYRNAQKLESSEIIRPVTRYHRASPR